MAIKGKIVRIGTRGSKLALKQTEIVAGLLREQRSELDPDIVTIRTAGDHIQNRSISSLGDKGVFVRPLEKALLSRSIDLAVHSLKDMPSDSETADLAIAAFVAREDPFDVLISRTGGKLNDLPRGARVGTGSMRRRIQLLELRPDLAMLDIRGNIDTRLQKLDEGQYDALVLAAAGLRRLKLEDRIAEYLPLIPDAGQGIIAVQSRRNDAAALVAQQIDNAVSRACALAERAVVRALGADCTSPIGVHGTIRDGVLEVRAVASHSNGTGLIRADDSGTASEPELLGNRLGQRIKESLFG